MADKRDFFAGLLFIAIGLGFFVTGFQYNLGSAARMGPGYFPVMLSGLLIVIGVVVSLRSLVKTDDTDARPLVSANVKSVASVIGGTVLFGIVLANLGLVLAIFALVITSSAAAGRAFHWQTFALAVALSAFSAAIFVFALGLSIPLWPTS